MTDWEPATEAEAALRDALRAGDQELYFRILSHVELLLPMSSAALSPRAGTGWGTWTSGGRTHVLAFTSPQAMTTCLAEHGGAARRMAYADLAGAWPNPEWWLAINPGLPIEGYLPAWFVSQLSRGDVRLPGRTIGARARVEAAAAAQAGGTPVPMSALAASAAARAAYARSVPPQPGAHQAPDAAPPRSAPTGRARVPAHAAPEPEPEHEPRRLTAIPPRPVLPSRTMAPPRAPTSPPRTPTPPAPTPPPPTTPPPPPPGAPAWRPGMPLPVRTPAEPAASFNPIGQAQPPAPPSPAPTPPAPAPSVPASPVPAPPAPAPSVPASPAPAPSPSIGRPRVIEGAIVEESRPAHAAAPSRPASSAPAARPEPYPLGTGADPTYVISTGRESGYPPPRAATVPPVDVERTQRVPPAEALTRPAARAETTTRSEPTTRSETTTRADTLTGSRAATRAARSGYPPSRDLDLDPSRDVDPGRDLGAGRDQTTGRRSDAARTDAARSDAGWLDAARAEPGRESGRARDRAPAATPPPEPATDRSATDRRATDRPATDEAATDRPDEADFTPANNVETELLAAAGDGQTDHFLSTLLLAKVLIPIPPKAPAGVRPGEPGFAWRREQVEGQPYMVVFTSTERMTEYLGAETDVVEAKFVQLISAWPDESWSFAVNPGTPVGATLPGVQIKALAVWAAEVGLTDQPAVEEGQPEMPVAGTEPEPAQRPVVMQKAISAAQVRYYLDRGYDRVSGFVQRASEVEHLTTPGQLYEALGLGYPQSPFTHDADEIYLLRWTAYRPDLYRIPFGGRDETSMRAMQGWVIERGPFRGNGFAPGETNDVIAEFKVDSARLPHGAQMWRMRRGRKETLVAMLDADGPRWRPVGADNEAAELD